jgi:hypothetical protein
MARELTDAGLETVYLDIAAQDAWGSDFHEFYTRIPYNNETRRNLGYLHAYQDGCEILLSLDDDNFPTEDDLVGGHLKTGNMLIQSMLSEPFGYHNICEYLSFSPKRSIFPRGFPFRLRGMCNSPKIINPPRGAIVGVTAGLWLREPDVDATTWLNGKIVGIAYTGPDDIVLEQKTWTPINTQNTSIVRELIPAYLCVPMGFDVPGGKIQRYGDIWGGYFMQTAIQGTCYHVAFGRPLVDHRRNPHNYVDDLRHEFWGMVLTDWMLEELKSNFQSTETEISARMLALSEYLGEDAVARLPSWAPPEVRNFLVETSKTMIAWISACRKVA